jgi:mannose-6-phosphate isomerase-like protein (cupin superfamily)
MSLGYVRRLRASSELPDSGLSVQTVVAWETVWIAQTHLPAGAQSTSHAHPGDQLHFVLEGGTQIRVGETESFLPEGAFAFVPAGTPHRVSNPLDGSAALLEITAPGLGPGEPVEVEPRETVSSDAAYVQLPCDGDRVEAMPGFFIRWLASRDLGSRNCAAYAADTDPGSGGPSMHIHQFDQVYVVLAGVLSVEIAGERHDVRPPAVVLLPAGVAHRQWNGGDVSERHLALLLPQPEPGQTLDYAVNFSLKGPIGGA